MMNTTTVMAAKVVNHSSDIVNLLKPLMEGSAPRLMSLKNTPETPATNNRAPEFKPSAPFYWYNNEESPLHNGDPFFPTFSTPTLGWHQCVNVTLRVNNAGENTYRHHLEPCGPPDRSNLFKK